MSDTVTPVGRKLAVAPIEEEAREEGGIYIPESVAQGDEYDKPQQGYVRAVGTQIEDIEKDARILYAKQAAFIGEQNKVEVDGEECILIQEKHVLAVIHE